MRLPKVVPGTLVEIRFWDHHENSEDPVEYLVYGRVHKTSKIAITVHTWALPKVGPVPEDMAGNVHTFSIVRSAITKINILRRARE